MSKMRRRRIAGSLGATVLAGAECIIATVCGVCRAWRNGLSVCLRAEFYRRASKGGSGGKGTVKNTEKV